MPEPITPHNRGPEKYPHWHDATEWAKRTTMTLARLLTMTPEAFHAWVTDRESAEDVKGWFFGLGWPEGHSYCYEHDYAVATGYECLCSNKHVPDLLLGGDRTALEAAGEARARTLCEARRFRPAPTEPEK